MRKFYNTSIFLIALVVVVSRTFEYVFEKYLLNKG